MKKTNNELYEELNQLLNKKEIPIKKKKPIKTKLLNELCLCGSGKNYVDCCLDKISQ